MSTHSRWIWKQKTKQLKACRMEISLATFMSPNRFPKTHTSVLSMDTPLRITLTITVSKQFWTLPVRSEELNLPPYSFRFESANRNTLIIENALTDVYLSSLVQETLKKKFLQFEEELSQDCNVDYANKNISISVSSRTRTYELRVTLI